MADMVLKSKRKVFIQSVSIGTINSLLDELLDKNVLSQEEMETVKYENYTAMDKARDLIDSVIRKGHHASQIFIIQISTCDPHLEKKLGLSSDMIGPAEPTEESTGTLKLCPPEEFLKLCKERADEVLCSVDKVEKKREEIAFTEYTISESTNGREIYSIKDRKDRTRLALIICNREFDHLPRREGAELDIIGMKGLLEGLGYSVEVEENLKAKEMESVLEAFAARPEHKSSDSTFLVFMSHGILAGICGTLHRDEKPDVLLYDTIFRMFNNCHCLSLKDKPKVIIVQACRGANQGVLWVSDSPAALADSSSQPCGDLEEDAVHRAHVEKDFIAFCSSTPHNISWRDIRKGSLFISQLITCFQKYSWRCHLEEVFRKVQRSFEKPDVKAQMPTIERLSMTRYFYLFPGN